MVCGIAGGVCESASFHPLIKPRAATAPSSFPTSLNPSVFPSVLPLITPSPLFFSNKIYPSLPRYCLLKTQMTPSPSFFLSMKLVSVQNEIELVIICEQPPCSLLGCISTAMCYQARLWSWPFWSKPGHGWMQWISKRNICSDNDILSMERGHYTFSDKCQNIQCLVFSLTAMRSFLHSRHHLPLLLPDDCVTLLVFVCPLLQKHQAYTVQENQGLVSLRML